MLVPQPIIYVGQRDMARWEASIYPSKYIRHTIIWCRTSRSIVPIYLSCTSMRIVFYYMRGSASITPDLFFGIYERVQGISYLSLFNWISLFFFAHRRISGPSGPRSASSSNEQSYKGRSMTWTTKVLIGDIKWWRGDFRFPNSNQVYSKCKGIS